MVQNWKQSYKMHLITFERLMGQIYLAFFDFETDKLILCLKRDKKWFIFIWIASKYIPSEVISKLHK